MSGTNDRIQSYAARQAGQRDEIAVIGNTFDAQRAKYEGMLGSKVSLDDFRNAFLIAVQTNWRLLEADRQSLWLALQKAAGDGLKPDGREAALVIFGDDEEDEEGNKVPSKANGKKKVVYMPMIAGLTKMVRNTGVVAGIRARLIYRGESMVVTDEDGKESYKLVRTIAAGEMIDDSPQNIIGAFAVVNYKDGTWEMEPMSRAQIDRVKATSRAKKGPWSPWYDEMAKKTVLRRLIKRLDRSAELRVIDAALERDETLTIEGKAEQPPAEITQEFTGPAADIGRQPDKLRRAETAQEPDRMHREDRPPQTEQRREDKPVDTKPPADQPAEQRSEQRQQPTDDIEVWAVDEGGEPVQNDPMNAVQFAKWLYDTLKVSKNPEAIREHNADAIGDAGANKQAAVIIQAAIEGLQGRHPAGDTKPAAETASAAGPKAIDIPTTPKGAPHWPNYTALAEEAIAKLATVADVNAWEALNKPHYAGKAAEIKIENRLKQRRAGLQSPAAGPDESDAAGIYADIEAEAKEVAGKAAVDEWFARANLQGRLKVLKGMDAALFEKAIVLIDERTLAG